MRDSRWMHEYLDDLTDWWHWRWQLCTLHENDRIYLLVLEISIFGAKYFHPWLCRSKSYSSSAKTICCLMLCSAFLDASKSFYNFFWRCCCYDLDLLMVLCYTSSSDFFLAGYSLPLHLKVGLFWAFAFGYQVICKENIFRFSQENAQFVQCFFDTIWKVCIDRKIPITNSKLFCCLLFFWSQAKASSFFLGIQQLRLRQQMGLELQQQTRMVKWHQMACHFQTLKWHWYQSQKKVNTEKWQK